MRAVLTAAGSMSHVADGIAPVAVAGGASDGADLHRVVRARSQVVDGRGPRDRTVLRSGRRTGVGIFRQRWAGQRGGSRKPVPPDPSARVSVSNVSPIPSTNSDTMPLRFPCPALLSARRAVHPGRRRAAVEVRDQRSEVSRRVRVSRSVSRVRWFHGLCAFLAPSLSRGLPRACREACPERVEGPAPSLSRGASLGARRRRTSLCVNFFHRWHRLSR